MFLHTNNFKNPKSNKNKSAVVDAKPTAYVYNYTFLTKSST